MLRSRSLLAAGLCLAAATSPAPAGAVEVDLSGYAAPEIRIFPAAGKYGRQSDRAVSPSFVVQPELRIDLDEANRITFIPFARFDSTDDERTHWDIRELNWLYDAGTWDMRVGVGKVFWGVTESRHLVDIINQTDLVESPDEEDKLGQPMVNLNILSDAGTFRFFVLPFFRERTFPGPEGRPGLPIPVLEDLATFESSREERHIDFAIRYEERFGPFDIGLAHFHGTSREPRLLPQVLPGLGPVLVPAYDIIDQTSVDAQATLDAWLLKVEAIVRSGQGDTFFATTAGFEYTLYQIFETGADLGLLSEYHYDGRDADAPFSIFDNDLLVGARLALNDPDDTSVLAGAITDLDTGTTFVTLEAATRLADGLKLEVEARAFPYVANGDEGEVFERDHFLEIRLQYFF